MLDAHDALARAVVAVETVGGEDGCPGEIGDHDFDLGGWCGLESHRAAPGHVLVCVNEVRRLAFCDHLGEGLRCLLRVLWSGWEGSLAGEV